MVVLAILFPLVAFLFPLTIYLVLLGILNRRRGPVVVPGPWDFAGVLFAASGFLLVGGPSVLAGVGDRWRIVRIAGQLREGQLGGEEWGSWILVWGIYFAVVLGGSALLLYKRRNVTSIYNIEPAVLELLLVRVLDGLGLSWMRSGNLYAIRPGSVTTNVPEEAITNDVRGRIVDVELVHAADVDAPAPSVELDAWAMMRHVNLIWRGAHPELRRQVEAELTRELDRVVSDENPAAGWFLSLAALSFCLMFGILLLLLAASIVMPR